MPPPELDAVTLRSFLAERDAPCPACGYNLRALTMDTCPECNAALDLRVGLVEPRLGAFLTGAIGLGAGIGFTCLILGFFLWEKAFGRRGGGPPWQDIVPLAVSAAVLLAELTVWIRTRARQRNIRPSTHWVLAVGCWLMTLAGAIWFFSMAR